MFILYALSFYAIFCGSILYILLMGQSPSHRHGIIGKINVWMRSCPGNCLYYCCLCANGFSRRKAEVNRTQAEEYCFEKPNPFVQAFYCFLVGFALYLFFDDIAPKMREFDLITTIIICLISMMFYLLAWLVDPGFVATAAEYGKMTPQQQKAEDAKNNRFVADGTHYTKQICSTCNVVKPARSKHCRLFNRCVRRTDHYCPWVVNVVGENNLRWFHLFLLSHVVMSGVVAYWSAWSIWRYIEKERLWDARFGSRTNPQEQMQPSVYIVMLYAMSQNSVGVGLVLFAGIVAILLFGFWVMQFRHVMRNETTNEMHKSEDLLSWIRHDERERLLAERQKILQQQDDELEDENADSSSTGVRKSNSCENEVFDESNSPLSATKQSSSKNGNNKQKKEKGFKCHHNNNDSTNASSSQSQNNNNNNNNNKCPITKEELQKVRNFYNGSLLSNIYEVLIPSSFAANPSARGNTNNSNNNNNNKNNNSSSLKNEDDSRASSSSSRSGKKTRDGESKKKK